MNKSYLSLYKKAMRDYHRLATDFMLHNDLTLSQMKEHYQNIGEDHQYVFIIRTGTIQAYIIQYYDDCLFYSQDHQYALSNHLTIYVMINEHIKEFDSLSIQRLKQKIIYLQRKTKN